MNAMRVLSTFTAPISPKERERAEQFSRQQATPEKGEQVRLNTLAVSFVNFYLECMGFETLLENSDSWNPVQQTLTDTAALRLKNLGDLECRPVLANTQFIYIPPEVQSSRIGYVIVQIHESFREATILGFVKQVSTESLSIVQLQPLEKLLEYLEDLSQARQAKLSSRSPAVSKNRINLKQWLDNIFEAGWQEISTVLELQIAEPAWRNARNASASRGKKIDLGKQTISQSVVLVVAVNPENSREMDIFVEVHPTSGQTYLPSNLQVSVLDVAGVAVMEASSRNTNKNIQLQFGAESGEYFSVKLALGEAIAIEDFII
ncbi:MAG: hypothetical protein CLLPBCKN_000269 [Chroococcidiopsis cubana SAG 39.79]|jgi:hypothetical protein|uniref:DUF1822 domain-containing protein n=1 Tax=Chroococcidiopsis cubana SAG 39.79 TaxID=388085 RepID=A0AB37UIW5_9CYAN|nr:DUF1822 family protein [Chroococcidiopsis cubana]MDZ4870881.1 hypothetical protein [Chroococcidiopsis cubana SAG 39.79]RUT11323.1 hypothetical protein DSM107010_33620 [Chroococcidiopsis cubana SAG 39.79]